MNRKYFITFIFACIFGISNADFDEDYAKQMVNFAAASFIAPQTKNNVDLANQCFEKSFPDGQWEKPEQYSRDSCAGFFKDECQLVIARSQKLNMVVIAFRGTIGKDQMDHEADASMKDYTPWTYNTSFGKVNTYFFNAAEAMWGDKVETYLNNYKGYKIAFTGHNLGGAIASLTALKARHLGLVDVDKVSLYTFGEPRIGDSDVAKNFRDLVKESYRVVHYSDLVPHLPLCDGFFSDSCTEKAGWPHHQPQEIWYYNTDLTMDNSKFKICDANGGEDPNCSDGISVLEFAKNIGTDRGADMHLHYYDHKLDEYGQKGCNSAVKFGLSFIVLIFLFIFNFIKQ